jgi:hypothetical protein
MTGLISATRLAAAASKPYPGDSRDYRRARTALLADLTPTGRGTDWYPKLSY